MFNLAAIFVAVFLMGYIPGRVIVGKLSFLELSGEEKLACSFGVSFFLYYLVGFAGYVIGFNKAYLHVLVPVIFIVIFILVLLKKNDFIPGEELRLLGIFLALFLVLVCFQALLPIYNGGGWMGDWYEHYDRMQFYLKSYDSGHRFLNVYLLPARPPMFNVVTYFFQSIFGEDFWVFQIVCSYMNLVVIMPVYLLLKRVLKIKSKYILIVAAGFFLLNPTFVRNLTYTWTRHLTNYYVLLGLYFYLRGRKGMDYRYIYAAFTFLAFGQLTHYSAAIYLLVILADFVFISVFRLRKNIKPLVIVGLILTVILSTWYLWSVSTYGAKNTFLSNTTYEAIEGKGFVDNIKKDWLNFRNTIIPYFLYPELRSVAGYFTQKSKSGFLYDSMLGFYSASLIGNLTITLSILLVVSLIVKPLHVIKSIREDYRKLSFKDFILNDTFFWVVFLVLCIIVGIRVNAPQICGCTHVTLQPVVILILCFIIKRTELIKSNFLKTLIVAGMVVEGIIVTGSRVLFEMPVDFNNRVFAGVFYGNYYLKLSNGLVFLYDKFAGLRPLFGLVVIAGLGSLMWAVVFHLFQEKS